MAEFNPCDCGTEKAIWMTIRLGIECACFVCCTNPDCDHTVVRFGLTKNHAERRAARAWNKTWRG